MRTTTFLAALLFAFTLSAQTVTRDTEGNWTAQQDTAKVATKYTYIDSKNKPWPVYQTKTGTYFAEITSSKSGKTYRKYLKP